MIIVLRKTNNIPLNFVNIFVYVDFNVFLVRD